MMYGTIKSEVWANMPNVAAEYFRWEVITRWQPQDEKDTENFNVTWTTHIIYIDRDGKYSPIETMSTWSALNEHWVEWLKINHVQCDSNGYGARSKMRQEHDYAIMLVIG